MNDTQNTKDSLKVTALTQRIAALVANYEEQLAEFRALATISQEQMQTQIRDISAENSNLQTELNLLRPEEPDVPQEDK